MTSPHHSQPDSNDPYVLSPEGLRRRSMAVFLACEASVAEDISKALKWAADEIEQLRGRLESLTRDDIEEPRP